MKILVVSDTHRHNENLEKVMEIEGAVDVFIHLGDIEGTEEEIRDIVKCDKCYMICGNNDYFSQLDREIKARIGNYNVWMTHGHNYYISLGYETLQSEAIAQGIDIVMCGHTHKPYLDDKHMVTVLNPGSISYPRQPDKKPSYAVIQMERGKRPVIEIKYLE